MSIYKKLLDQISDGKPERVMIGLHWTGVTVQKQDGTHCGLSSTISLPHTHGHGFDVPDAGKLTKLSALELATMCTFDNLTLASVGTAALNALMPEQNLNFVEINAEEIISQQGKGERVVIVGHFPFIDKIREISSHLDVLENNPRPGDIHASKAPDVIPNAKVVAITGMTFVNHTMEQLLELCHPEATIIVLGASTPLHPILFDYGVDYLCGALVENADQVMRTVGEGAVYRQIMKAGLKLVTAKRSG